MKQYNVTGMSCAACSARVEKAVNAVPGVTSCSVNLLTNSMGVEGEAAENEIIKAVVDAGYGATVKGSSRAGRNTKDSSAPDLSQTSHHMDYYEAREALEDHETPKLKKRLFTSLGFLLVLMYFSMGHMMWGWPVSEFFDHNMLAQGLLQLILSAIIMVINQKFFISGFKSLLHKSPNNAYVLYTKDAPAPSATSVSMFGASFQRLLKPLTKNF